MDVRPCRNCKRLFNYLSGTPICPSCQDKLEKKFREVKAYINEHPSAGIKDISEDVDVTTKQLKTWIREERLKFADDSPVGIECMNCGKTIKFGKYCEACKGKMISNLSKAVVRPQQDEGRKPLSSNGNKMRFLDS